MFICEYNLILKILLIGDFYVFLKKKFIIQSQMWVDFCNIFIIKWIKTELFFLHDFFQFAIVVQMQIYRFLFFDWLMFVWSNNVFFDFLFLNQLTKFKIISFYLIQKITHSRLIAIRCLNFKLIKIKYILFRLIDIISICLK